MYCLLVNSGDSRWELLKIIRLLFEFVSLSVQKTYYIVFVWKRLEMLSNKVNLSHTIDRCWSVGKQGATISQNCDKKSPLGRFCPAADVKCSKENCAAAFIWSSANKLDIFKKDTPREAHFSLSQWQTPLFLQLIIQGDNLYMIIKSVKSKLTLSNRCLSVTFLLILSPSCHAGQSWNIAIQMYTFWREDNFSKGWNAGSLQGFPFQLSAAGAKQGMRNVPDNPPRPRQGPHLSIRIVIWILSSNHQYFSCHHIIFPKSETASCLGQRCSNWSLQT